MSSNQSTVAVIIPVHNAEKYIKSAIDSVIQQNYKDLEIIVVNDGSTDNTVELIKKYSHVRLISQEKKGASIARNMGLENTKADYIKFLDADDFLVSGIIKTQVDIAETLPDNYIPYGYLNYTNSLKGKKFHKIHLGKNQIDDLLLRSIQTSLPLHRRLNLLRIGGFNTKLQFRQEWNLHVRLALEGYHFYFHDDLVVNYRNHNDPKRITNRMKIGKLELGSLDQSFSDFIKYENFKSIDAFACNLWKIGREFELNNLKHDANELYSRASELSNGNFLRFLTTKEKVLRFIYGPLTARYYRKFKKLIQQF